MSTQRLPFDTYLLDDNDNDALVRHAHHHPPSALQIHIPPFLTHGTPFGDMSSSWFIPHPPPPPTTHIGDDKRPAYLGADDRARADAAARAATEETRRLDEQLALSLPSTRPLPLPLYSASGFDVLPLLARLASRPSPQIPLGPVDLSCAFVVAAQAAAAAAPDAPIVYASPAFLALTGYDEADVVGRDCRFLQSSPSRSTPSSSSSSSSSTPTLQMRRAVSERREVQVSTLR